MLTPIEAKTKLVKLQIASLAKVIFDRDPDFDPLTEEDLAAMTLVELERVHKAYHEIAYAPPSK